jgi:hypothetical protein
MSSYIPSFVGAKVKFLERSIRLQRRAFNFRRGMTNASATSRVIATMFRHTDYVS